ncbi:MAG: hypothetical protein AAGD14_03130 [Planctomycetota bacterium]
MKKLSLILLLAFSTMGCAAAAAALLLSGGDVDDLVDNFEESIETQQRLAEYAMSVARGEVDIQNYTYDPPSQANGMVGTLSLSDGQLPFGDGNITVTFNVDGDGVPVDPYAVDLSGMGSIDSNVQISFNGISPNGKTLAITSDVDIATLANSATDVTALMSGNWAVDLDDYQTGFSSNGLELDVDLINEEVTRAIGVVDGNIDLPNFPIDGSFDVEGLGDQLEIGIDVAVTEIEFLVDLVDIF